MALYDASNGYMALKNSLNTLQGVHVVKEAITTVSTLLGHMTSRTNTTKNCKLLARRHGVQDYLSMYYLAGIQGVEEVVDVPVAMNLRQVNGGGGTRRPGLVQQLNHVQVSVPCGSLHRFPGAALNPVLPEQWENEHDHRKNCQVQV